MRHPPVVAKSCSNPGAHKATVHYQRGSLVESRPCWQVVPLPSPETSTILILNPYANPLYSCFLDFPNTPILSARPLSLSITPVRSCPTLYNPRLQLRLYAGKPAPLPVMISSATQTFTRTTFPRATRGLPPPCLSVTHSQTCKLR